MVRIARDGREHPDGPYAAKDDAEMNVREARLLAKELRAGDPDLRVEVWPIAQGLCYLRVEKELHPGLLRRVVKNRREARELP